MGLSLVRNRTAILLAAMCVASTVLFIAMNGAQRSTIHSLIVTETKNQIDNLKKNFKEERKLVVDDRYLDRLAIESRADTSRFWPNSTWRRAGNASEPVVVSAVQNGRAGEAVHFVRNAVLFLPEAMVILYDLGLSSHEFGLVEKYCNTSTCKIVKFDYGEYPRHVRNLKNFAFRPLVIQETLRDAGCVLWLDVNQRFTNKDLEPFLSRARGTSGVLAWPMEDQFPTSALTHPKMFSRLGVSSVEDYNFQHMVDMRALLVYNLASVNRRLMTPWVKCALLSDCIEPIGAQSSGCRFDKKPQFRYTGCHSYDISALNIILGRMFKFDEEMYMAEGEFFVRMSEDMEDAEEEGSSGDNATAAGFLGGGGSFPAAAFEGSVGKSET